MVTRKHRPMPSLPWQLAELAFAVPQVMGHRITRMALAGVRPSARDRREFNRMGAEKTEAFTESWIAMAMAAAVAQQQFTLGLMSGSVWPWGADWARTAHAVLGTGLAPVHRRALANARRLGAARLR